MQYFFDYGFVKDQQWLDGVHKKEQYENGKQAFARYLEIQRKGKAAEEEMKKKGMLPEGNRFLCSLDIRHNGEYNLAACMKFFFDAWDILHAENIQIQSSEPIIP